MSKRIKWSDGREFDMVTDLSIRQMIEVEKAFKMKLSQFGEAHEIAAAVMVTLRENGIALSLDAVLDLKMGKDFDVIDAEEPAAPLGRKAPSSPRRKSA